MIHIVLIVIGKMIVNEIPGISDAVKWTIVNLGYMLISYIMFHYSTGVPFESNAGVYDDLTLWEQIDNGAQYTPAKKYLTSVPIGLCVAAPAHRTDLAGSSCRRTTRDTTRGSSR